MKNFFNQFLSGLKSAIKAPETPASELASLRHILSELDHLEPKLAKFLAAFAFILYRVASADQKITPDEIQSIEKILMRWGHLTEPQAVLVAELAKTQNRIFGGTDNFLVTREFKEFATDAQKQDLLDCLFAVAASDDSVTNDESDLVRVISKELGLEHADFIAARRQFVEKLAVLK